MPTGGAEMPHPRQDHGIGRLQIGRGGRQQNMAAAGLDSHLQRGKIAGAIVNQGDGNGH